VRRSRTRGRSAGPAKREPAEPMLGWALIILAIIAITVFLFMYLEGGVNQNKFIVNPMKKFNGITQFSVSLPDNVVSDSLALVRKKAGKRVVIPEWKAGRTIPTSKMPDSVMEFYKGLCPLISKKIGEKVYVTPDSLPTTCAILTYDEQGDFINWHYDVNYFNGRFFTFLIMLEHSTPCSTKYVYKDPDNKEIEVDMEPGECILFEGPMVYHSASKLGFDEHRSIFSMQFSTDPTISWYNRALMRLKDLAYIG
jgi:hypothetical protein